VAKENFARALCSIFQHFLCREVNVAAVMIMSRSLNKCEQKYSAVEKEVSAIIEATRKWSQFLKGRHFTLVTDQRSVAFMFDQKNRGKIKKRENNGLEV